MMHTLELHQVVKLANDRPELNVTENDTGTIVHIYSNPDTAFEVEFCDDQGRTTAMETLKSEELIPFLPIE